MDFWGGRGTLQRDIEVYYGVFRRQESEVDV